MRRLVYFAGFANPAASAEFVASQLADHLNYDNYAAFTIGDALAQPEQVARAVRSQLVITHSLGMAALRGTAPERLHAFNPPTRSTRGRLVYQTVARRWKESDLVADNIRTKFEPGFLEEVRAHPVRHLSPFLNGTVSRFDAFQAARHAQESGVQTGLAFTDRDCYVQPTEEQVSVCRSVGVKVAFIPGVHDELALRPNETFDRYLEKRL